MQSRTPMHKNISSPQPRQGQAGAPSSLVPARPSSLGWDRNPPTITQSSSWGRPQLKSQKRIHHSPLVHFQGCHHALLPDQHMFPPRPLFLPPRLLPATCSLSVCFLTSISASLLLRGYSLQSFYSSSLPNLTPWLTLCSVPPVGPPAPQAPHPSSCNLPQPLPRSISTLLLLVLSASTEAGHGTNMRAKLNISGTMPAKM